MRIDNTCEQAETFRHYSHYSATHRTNTWGIMMQNTLGTLIAAHGLSSILEVLADMADGYSKNAPSAAHAEAWACDADTLRDARMLICSDVMD